MRKLVVAAAAGFVAALAFAAPAMAHVTVNPNQADPGSYARVAFRVPNETDNANTTRIQVYLPTSTPIASVSVEPVPGWTIGVRHTTLSKPIQTDDGPVTEAVSVITWTAGSGAAIKPGQFQEFPVSLGPLPKSGSLTFKALQTYSDGTVVRWIQTGGGESAENPAPVLTIGSSATPQATAVAAKSTAGSSSGGALTVAVIALVVGAIGLLLGGLAFLRSRRA